MNFNIQHQQLQQQRSYIAQYQSTQTSQGLHPTQIQNNENLYSKPPLTSQPMLHRHHPSQSNSGNMRQFGKELQNMPSFSHPFVQPLQQSEKMEIDEANTFQKAQKVQQPQIFITMKDRSQSRAKVSNNQELKECQEQQKCNSLEAGTEKQQTIEINTSNRNLVLNLEQLQQIDIKNRNNPQYCSEYASEIYDYLKQQELGSNGNANYMSHQPEINDKMRSILIDWLIEVHLKFKLLPETLFITVSIIDRYLEKQKVSKSRLQLVGVTALFIASKYEEIYPPEIKDFVFITDNAYSKQDVIQMEYNILSILSFDITFPTAFRFLERQIKLIGDDISILYYAQFLIELALTDLRMIQYSPSLISTAAICLSFKLKQQSQAFSGPRITNQLIGQGNQTTRNSQNKAQLAQQEMDKKWESYISQQFSCNENDLKLCAKELQFLQAGSMNSSLRAVRNKFASNKYMCIHHLLQQF